MISCHYCKHCIAIHDQRTSWYPGIAGWYPGITGTDIIDCDEIHQVSQSMHALYWDPEIPICSKFEVSITHADKYQDEVITSKLNSKVGK